MSISPPRIAATTVAACPPVDPSIDTGLAPIDRHVLAVRLLGYLGHHDQAVALADAALTEFPHSARLLRLRGEKRLLVRDHRGAVADLEAAVAALPGESDHHEYHRGDVEHDVLNLVLGRPAAALGPQVPERHDFEHDNIDRSTLHTVTWHHLGIARYLVGDFAAAADAFTESQRGPGRDHIHVAAVDWQYLALRRAGRDTDAEACLIRLDDVDLSAPTPAVDDVPLSLTDGYRQRLRMYRGDIGPEVLLRNDAVGPLAVATLGYGVGAWYLLGGHHDAARRVWRRVIELGAPASSGYLAAEVELERP